MSADGRRDQLTAALYEVAPVWLGFGPEQIADALLPTVEAMIADAEREAAARGAADGPWRVGNHYGIHVYEGDRPVATFHQPEDAAQCVRDRAAACRARPLTMDNLATADGGTDAR